MGRAARKDDVVVRGAADGDGALAQPDAGDDVEPAIGGLERGEAPGLPVGIWVG